MGVADKNGAVADLLMKYPFGYSHTPTQLQICLQKMVLTNQTNVLLSCHACMEPMAAAGFLTSEYKISSLAATVDFVSATVDFV